MVLSGEITAPRAWPRNDSPELDAERFGSYLVFEQLGIGGMASVHRAERRVGGTRQRVALKRLLPHASSDDELVKLFLDEAQLVKRLRHRNIAEVYDFGRAEGEYFLAMELVAGPTLKQLLRHCASTVGLIPYPIAVTLLMQVCDALAYAHDVCDENGKPMQLVHRDVSPSNIVISTNGVLKLIDFGVAKTTTSHTQAGVIKGKLAYIAPEYLDDTGLDRRADLWAVGVVAYELLTNQRLFSGDDDLELMRQVRAQTIVPPSHHNPDVPPELEWIVMTALERDPEQRWQNATALRNALASVTRPSTNAEVMEWVEWVFALHESGLRPVRGSRPHPAVRPSLLAAEPVIPLPASRQAPSRPSTAPTPKPSRPAAAAAPVLPVGRQLPLPAVPTPTGLPVAKAVGMRLAQPYRPPVGAAMVARRRRRRSLLVPLLLVVLGGLASALAVPTLYAAIVSRLGS